MSRIEILEEKCTGCRKCISVCPVSAIHREGKKVSIASNCTFCGLCVKVCPDQAIRMEKKEKEVDLSSWRGVWVLAEQKDGQVSPVTHELLGAGRNLADDLREKLALILVGEKLDRNLNSLENYYIDRIYLIESPLLKQYNTSFYTQILVDLVRKEYPEIILIAATALGRDLAPRIATRLQTGLTADCTGLRIDDGHSRNLIQVRPAFGGNIMATIICPHHRPQIATVRPKVMTKLPSGGGNQAEIIRINPSLSLADRLIEITGLIKEDAGGVDLQEAEIIVSGGRGLGKAENFSSIRQLADLLGGAVGASRAVVDAGWIPSYHQVGQTGKTVQPRLYIACGISGAIQHQVGMRTSEVIVAINKDPEAPIFNIATYGIVENLHHFLPVLLERLRQERK